MKLKSNHRAMSLLVTLAIVLTSLAGQALNVEAAGCGSIHWYNFTSGYIDNNPNSSSSLQWAVNNYSCVGLSNANNPSMPATLYLTYSLVIPAGNELLGSSNINTNELITIKAYSGVNIAVLINSSGPGTILTNFQLDASGAISGGTQQGANVGFCCSGTTIDTVHIFNTRCDGVQISGAGMVVKNSQIDHTGLVYGSGTDCPAVAAGIYLEGHAVQNAAPDIENNTLSNTSGAELDDYGVWGGTFKNNTLSGYGGNGVQLYGVSNWDIEYNTINGPENNHSFGGQPYCTPSSPGSSAVILCRANYHGGPTNPSDPGYLPSTVTSNNIISNNNMGGNHLIDHYGVLAIGAEAVDTNLIPGGNTITNNEVIGSIVGCADDNGPSEHNAAPLNTWSGNDCAGTPNTPPNYF